MHGVSEIISDTKLDRSVVRLAFHSLLLVTQRVSLTRPVDPFMYISHLSRIETQCSECMRSNSWGWFAQRREFYRCTVRQPTVGWVGCLLL